MDTENNQSLSRVEEIALRLLDRLEQAVKELDTVTVKHREKVKTPDGEHSTEYDVKLPRKKGIIDRGGLKQLTGVLKDLQDILKFDPQLDQQEKYLRLERLRRELDQEENSEGVTVILEGEAKRYAD